MLAQSAPITAASMTSFDWLLAGVVLLSALLAFRKGFIRVMFSLLGLAAGVLLASWNYLAFAAWLHCWILSVPTAQVVAFLAILLGVLFVFSAAAGLVRKAVRAVGLGFADRLAGAAVGGARGILLGVVGLMAIAAFDPSSNLARNSVLAPYFFRGAHALSFVVPQGFAERMSVGARHLTKSSSGVL